MPPILQHLLREKHWLWLMLWLGGLAALGIWDAMFLNGPAFVMVATAFGNTLVAGSLVVMFSLLMGWGGGVGLHVLEVRNRKWYLVSTFILNVVRSVPQIVGVLVGYILLTALIETEVLRTPAAQLTWMALTISVFVVAEMIDLVRERIEHFSKLDFVPALLCAGVRECRIVNREILWTNSRVHIFQKLVWLFGVAVFLQCSIDFIVSVGLSTEISLTNFPVTLGSLLSKLDSKQDILAVGRAFFDVHEAGSLFFLHLQGISVTFLIVFTLLSVYKISNGLVTRYRL